MKLDALEKLDPESYPAYPDTLINDAVQLVIGDREDRSLSVREFKKIMTHCRERYERNGWQIPITRHDLNKLESLCAFHAGRPKRAKRIQQSLLVFAQGMMLLKQRDQRHQRPKMKAKGKR